MKIKKMLAIGAAVLMLGASSVAVYGASAYKSIPEMVAGITGRTIESVIDERVQTGKSYATIASDAGKTDEYIEGATQLRKDVLDARVAAGLLTQEEADALIAACDGTGTCTTGTSACLTGGACGGAGAYGTGAGGGACGGLGAAGGRGGCGLGSR